MHIVWRENKSPDGGNNRRTDGRVNNTGENKGREWREDKTMSCVEICSSKATVLLI